MRMMLKASLDVTAANQAIKDGSLPRTVEGLMQSARPEAAYFTVEKGKRTMFFFFDMKDPSQMPMIAEPFFQNLKAEVDFTPVMDAKDLKAGLEQLMATARA